MQLMKVGRHVIQLSNLEKELFPKDYITKGDLIQYYHNIADIMIPHMKNHPITMQRFPNGITQEGFYQKDISDYFPAWIKSVPVTKQEGGIVRYALCNDAATLIYLANQGCITLHLWLSTKSKLDYPDRLIFDLDASHKDFASVKKTAFLLKDVFETLELVPFVMTTGSRGLHVVVPLKKRDTFDEVRSFARDLAEYLVHEHPDMLTLEMHKEKRKKRIFLDILRNAFGQTGVAPYAVRALPGAPVATPITWQELQKSVSDSQQYTIKNIFRRLGRRDDPWDKFDTQARSLSSARKKLRALMSSS